MTTPIDLPEPTPPEASSSLDDNGAPPEPPTSRRSLAASAAPDPYAATPAEYDMSQVVEVPSQRVSYSGELAELSTGAPELLTLPTRRVLYLVAIAAVFAGPIVSVAFPEWGTAIVTAGNGIGVIALGTALANPTKS